MPEKRIFSPSETTDIPLNQNSGIEIVQSSFFASHFMMPVPFYGDISVLEKSVRPVSVVDEVF